MKLSSKHLHHLGVDPETQPAFSVPWEFIYLNDKLFLIYSKTILEKTSESTSFPNKQKKGILPHTSIKVIGKTSAQSNHSIMPTSPLLNPNLYSIATMKNGKFSPIIILFQAHASQTHKSSIPSSAKAQSSMLPIFLIASSDNVPSSTAEQPLNTPTSWAMISSLLHRQSTLPQKFQIGRNCLIQNAIIDKHVHIGDDVQLTNKKNSNITIAQSLTYATASSSSPAAPHCLTALSSNNGITTMTIWAIADLHLSLELLKKRWMSLAITGKSSGKNQPSLAAINFP